MSLWSRSAPIERVEFCISSSSIFPLLHLITPTQTPWYMQNLSQSGLFERFPQLVKRPGITGCHRSFKNADTPAAQSTWRCGGSCSSQLSSLQHWGILTKYCTFQLPQKRWHIPATGVAVASYEFFQILAKQIDELQGFHSPSSSTSQASATKWVKPKAEQPKF